MDNRNVAVKLRTPQRGPLAAVFNASTKCDAKCSFCSYWREENSEVKELSTEKKKSIINELADCGVWLLSLCSAEPLLLDDLEEVIREAKKRGMLVNISTNGANLLNNADVLVKSGVDTINVSIDSKDPHLHDELRGYPGLFDKLSRGIRAVHEARRGRKRPWIIARSLVHARNYLDLQEFVRYWYGNVDEIVFKPILESRDGILNVPEAARPRDNDEKAFRSSFNVLLTSYPHLDTAYHRAIPDFLFGGMKDSSWRCFAGSFFTDIDAEGNVYPCREYGRSMGNILEEGFMNIWTSEKMAEYRKYMKSIKRCSGCWGDKFASGTRLQKILEFFGGI